MSEQPEQSEKTEDPSLKKLQDAHEKGDVVKSQEVTSLFMIFGSAMVFALVAPMTATSVLLDLRGVIEHADRFEVGEGGFGGFVSSLGWAVIGALLIPLGLLALCAVAGNLVQHRLVFSGHPLQPKLSKISPLAGAKRLFSSEALVNFGKGLFKLVALSALMVAVVWPDRDRLATIMTVEPAGILSVFQEIGIRLFVATLVAVAVIAVVDYLYMRHKWWRRQMMTVKETRDEYKQMEGDPHVKGRIRQLRLERSRRRMMAAVPEAAVVITNPTHYAVALKYDKSMPAPQVVAKGVDAVALRIRALAAEHDIPIVENPPLARALHAAAEPGDTIPEAHFKAVAQVIGYVLRLKEKRRWSSPRP